MKTLIRILKNDGGSRTLAAGLYLDTWAPDAYDGCGKLETTPWPDEAMTFPDRAAAVAYWNAVLAHWQTRPEKAFNRLATAFTAEIVNTP
jgi:hypothetical protein